MELDERLRWIEIRVTSSIKPRAEELKWLFSNTDNREVMFEFCNSEEKRHLIVCSSNVPGEGLVASFKAPSHLPEKAVFFVKINQASKLTRDNIASDVIFCDCSKKPLGQLKRLVKDVYLPLLSIEHGGSVSADKLMDLLHRIVANLHVFDGNVQDKVALSLPSIEVLSEAAAFSGRRPAVMHVLETTVIHWIKQIKASLKLDPDMETNKYGGSFPGPLTEIEMWSGHLEKLNFINEQLRSPVAVNILMNLEEANSSYGQSFHLIKKELAKAEAECHVNLQYLSTLLPWFQKLHAATSPSLMVTIFPPLMHTLFLVWVYSRYYHEKNNFYRLLSMLSNEVVQRAKSLVSHDVLEKLDESFQSLKDALRVCASFRGCYLDKKDKADVFNRTKLSNTSSSEPLELVRQKKIFTETKGGVRKAPLSVAFYGAESVDTWSDSPWPARNNHVFATLNSFMERCNDVLELVQTTTHFKMLKLAAMVGGAGGRNLDSLVEEIYVNFEEGIENIKESNLNVLGEGESHQFEKAFFSFRSVMMNLERRLADVLRQSFKQCPDTATKLRLLEVFEGASGRELVQEHLFDICDRMLMDFTKELLNVKQNFERSLANPPEHAHLPPVASKLMWLKGLKARTGEPMSKLRKLSVSSFKGDKGWKVRDTYTDLVKEIERAESQITTEWQNAVQEDLRTKLKQPLLIRSDLDGVETVQVNLDPDLLSLLREVSYLADPPFSIKLPESARLLLRNVDISLLRSTAAKLETIVSRYNAIHKNIQPDECQLFERKLLKIKELLEQGLSEYSWRTAESADFVEHLCSLVCEDVHRNLCVVQRNYKEISNIVSSWSDGSCLECAFSSREKSRSYSIAELDAEHREMYKVTEHSIVMGGNRIHGLLLSTFEAVQISRASPAWQNYLQCISELVLGGLKKSVIVSLKAMVKHISSVSQDNNLAPVLTIRLELSGSQVVFNPKLDQDDASSSVQEYIEQWIQDFLKRGDMVKPLEPGLKSYQSLIVNVDEVEELITEIRNIVNENAGQCQELLGAFRQYAFLWMQDVESTFKEFLAGNIVAHPRYMTGSEMLRSEASRSSQRSKREKGASSSRNSPGAYSLDASGALGLSDKTFLNPKKDTSVDDVATANVPSLDDFDKEIEIFRKSRDEIRSSKDRCDVGCIRVNMCPIKQVLQTYASKWMFTYTKHLSDQVSSILNDLDSFLKRIEPGVEAITGEERDITSFMRLMGIFNEINTQQSAMDSKFVAMKRSIMLLEKFDQKLPDTTQKFYAAAPQKWNNLKLKVAQAKQRLGPRIQSEEKSVTSQLEAFGNRSDLLVREFMGSDAFNRKCLIYTAFNIMDLYQKKMVSLANEAEDLIELQELLQKNIVNFSILPQLESDLNCLREVWNIFRAVQEQQNGWRRQRWRQLDTQLLHKGLDSQLEMVRSLPSRSKSWDVSMGMLDSIVDMQTCLPIVEDLQKAALRPRHWKQLVRLAGENINPTPSEGLVKMSLGQLIEFGLHHHAEDVRAVIQKASKDVAIERSLKTYEEVWLSKVFELKRHKKARASSAALVTAPQEAVGSEIDSEAQGFAGPRGVSGRFSVTSYGSGGLSHKESKTRRTSPSLHSGAFSQSLINLTQDSGPLCLLTNCDPIFDELESHQVSLQSMVCGTAASSFTDDIFNWQKQLHTIEAVLTVWLEVQEKWVELEDIYASFEIRVALPHESNLFAAVNRDFRILMKATERNTNVLQSCSRTNIQAKLEKMQMNLQLCWKALLILLERRQQKFPRFFFLSPEDVLHVICNGHDPTLVNQYLSKVYENIAALQHTDVGEENPSAYQITGIVSVMEERLDFSEATLCDGAIELWLANMEKSVKLELNEQLRSAVNSFKENEQPLSYVTNNDKTWLLENAAEVVLLVTHIDLTKSIEMCLEEKNQKNSLKMLLYKTTLAIKSACRLLKLVETDNRVATANEFAEKGSSKRHSISTRRTASRASASVREETQSLYSVEDSLKGRITAENCRTPSSEERSNGVPKYSPCQTQKLVNLIALLMNKKDFIRGLLEKVSEGNALLSKSFEWSSQLKYEYSKQDSSLVVKILDASFSYGMEYQGACPRMVITPMTDQCFISLAQAVKCHMVGMCIGPSGSRKNETVHDFAKACGQPFYPFTCTTTMDQQFLTGVFKGLAMTGAWICFRQLNVMEKSVLSVVIKFFQSVMNSLKDNKSSVFLDNEEVTLAPSAACFGTLSSASTASEPLRKSFEFFPSVQSTLSDLPRDLLDRLRTVSLVRPDTRIIAEISLVSHGFTTATRLSKAMAELQSLCETFIPSFTSVDRDARDMPSCMRKGSGWSALCIKKIIANAATRLTTKVSYDTAVAVSEGEPTTVPEFIDGSDVSDQDGTKTEKQAPGTAQDTDGPGVWEETALLEAIRDTFVPGLSESDAAMLSLFTVDVFEGTVMPMILQSGSENGRSRLNEPVSDIYQIGRKGNSSAPIKNVDDVADDPSAIAIATARLGLQPGAAFQARVIQLAQLISAHKTVAVVGPAGCGKTECIKTLAAVHRDMGRILRRDTVCTGTLQSSELMGYFDPNTREWKDGLLPAILRKHVQQLNTNEVLAGVKTTLFTKWIHLDGVELNSRMSEIPNFLPSALTFEVIDRVQAEAFDAMIQNNGTVVFPSGERIKIPAELEIIWEMENLEHVSPTTISQIGLLCMNTDDVGWNLVANKWIDKKHEREAELLRTLCERYIGPTLEFLSAKTSVPPQPGAPPTKTRSQALQHVVHTSELNMVETLIALVEASVSFHPDLMPAEYENYFNFAAIWAFGGTLIERHRVHFSQWWKKKWKDYIMLPGDGEVWDYFVSSDTNEFCFWSEAIQPYAMRHGEGIPQDAYVHTVYNESLSRLVGLLSDVGRPVMLVGQQGCGKTSVIRDKLTNQDSDVAELQSLSVYCNQFTTSQTLWNQINGCLEWKHGRTYVPKGNKKLICLVDDLNLSKVNSSDIQPANELVRGLIDHGGAFDPETHQWREVKHVTYHTTYNPYTSATVPMVGNRLLRHFSLFHVPFPSVKALQTIYSCLLTTHFFVTKQHTSGGSVTQLLLEGSTAESHSAEYIQDEEPDTDAAFRQLLSSVVLATIELQNDLRVMYLPTAPRCHYIFTMADLTMVFRNLCLSLRRGCSVKDLLLLWRHECDWVYNRRLVDHVDRERYQQTFVNAVKKEFSSLEQIQIVLREDEVLFTNLVETEDSGMSASGDSTSGGTEKYSQLTYRPLYDVQKVKTILNHGIGEYNKDFPKIKLVLYEDTVEAMCRLVRVLQSPHECSHATIVSEGSPGSTSSMVKLAAHLCGFSLYQINSSSIAGTSYSIENFKSDLVSAYRKAGVKREKLLLLLGENDMVNKHMMVYISEFLVSSCIEHLFSEEERTSAINSVRSDVTQAGLTYTKSVAWSFFLKTVKENLRIVLYMSSRGAQFQQRCREFPGLTNSVPIMFFPHSSRENLVARASYHLQGMERFDSTGKENMAHLFASMHLSLRENDPSEDASGSYGHITDTTFEKFIECFDKLFKERHASICEEFTRMAAAVKNIDKATEVAGQRLKQLEHERLVLEQKKESNSQLLSQIGQDKAIAEEQIKLVTKQHEKINQLQKALPKLKEAHERAVFKAGVVISDIKRLLQTLDLKALGELRALQKPDPEIEDLLAAVIILIKSPSSDLTWNKGAKRIMANLDRFCDELGAFDQLDVPESTLRILDTYLSKPHFNSAYMSNRTDNSVVVLLVTWVSEVARYHTMMLSKVKPLQSRVEETSDIVGKASDKLSVLNKKLRDLDTRLRSLAQAYEEASIDKCRQKKLTEKLNTQLERAGYFEKVLAKARQKWNVILQTITNREAAITGICSMAAAYATYLGPYSHPFRRAMLAVHWTKCLKERGVPLEVRLPAHYKLAGENQKDYIDGGDKENVNASSEGDTSQRVGDNLPKGDLRRDDERSQSAIEIVSVKGSSTGSEIHDLDKNYDDKLCFDISKYDAYILTLLSTLPGYNEVTQGALMGTRLMENATISVSSWQRPSFLIDPHGRGLELIKKLENSQKLVEIDASDGDQSCLMNIERAITSGSVLVVRNVNETLDSIFIPLIYKINTAQKDQAVNDDPAAGGLYVICGGRRLICHPDFKLYLVSSSHFTSFTPEIASITTLVNFTFGEESFAEEILTRSFSRIQPELWSDSLKTREAYTKIAMVIEDLDSKLIDALCDNQGADDTDLIAEMVQCRAKMAKRLEHVLQNSEELVYLKKKYQPLSQLVTVLFKAINSLSRIQHEYRFSVDYYLTLFEIALEKVVGPPKKTADVPHEPEASEEPDKLDSEALMIQETGVRAGASGTSKLSVPLPPEVELPTPSVVYEEISPVKIGEIIDELTRTVFQSLFRSIYDHHRLTFGLVLSFMVRKETLDDGTFDKQLELLISGGLSGTHHLSLADFDPTLLTPTWISSDGWQSLLSLSSIPGPLEGLCTKVATDQAWQEWYVHDSPETLDFPRLDHNSPSEGDDVEDCAQRQDLEDDSISEFHELLIVRCLRPDRLTCALKNYVVNVLDSLNAPIHIPFSEMLSQIQHSIPIIVLLPESSFLEMSTDSPSKAIIELAEKKNIPWQHVIVASGHESITDVALATAVRTDGWIIIENIHLASISWLKQLYIRLSRLRFQAETSSSAAQWRVFLTSKPSILLPESLINLAHPVAWDFIQMESDEKTGPFDRPLSVDLVSVITTSLNKIPKALWEEVKRGSLFLRTIIFRLCIFHGILCTRQKFGARAMIKEYPFGIYDLEHAISVVLQLCTSQDIEDPATIKRLSYSVIEIVYGGKMTEKRDNEYRKCLARQVFDQQEDSTLTIGEVTFPLPPINVEPTDYGQWFKEKLQDTGEDKTLTAVYPNENCKVERDEAIAFSILEDLAVLKFDSPLVNIGTTIKEEHDTINMVDLRRNLEMVLDRLPTLLNIPSSMPRPSEILPKVLSQLRPLSLHSEANSIVSAHEERPAETMSYAIEQECEWFNTVLCHVRQSLCTLEERILCGAHAIPLSMNDIAIPLQAGLVPDNWLHVNLQPSAHSLCSWLDEMHKCHKQLEKWVEKGLVSDDQHESVLRCRRIDKIWLGGLVNPAAILLSLKHEKAINVDCPLEKVTLQCYAVSSDRADFDEEPGDGITFTDLYLEGGLWDTNGLTPSCAPSVKLFNVFVKAVCMTDANESNTKIYDCPVYRNRSRQYCPFKLPLKCSVAPENLLLKGVALIIDPGEIRGPWKVGSNN